MFWSFSITSVYKQHHCMWYRENQKPCFSHTPFSQRERAYPAALPFKLLSPKTPKSAMKFEKKRAFFDLCSWVDTMCSSKFFLKEPLIYTQESRDWERKKRSFCRVIFILFLCLKFWTIFKLYRFVQNSIILNVSCQSVIQICQSVFPKYSTNWDVLR